MNKKLLLMAVLLLTLNSVYSNNYSDLVDTEVGVKTSKVGNFTAKLISVDEKKATMVLNENILINEKPYKNQGDTVSMPLSIITDILSAEDYKKKEKRKNVKINEIVFPLLDEIDGKYSVNDETVYVQRIIEKEGSKKGHYDKILEYIVRSYNDAQSVIQIKDENKGLIILKGFYSFNYNEVFWGSGIEWKVYHIIKFEAKDNKIRVTLNVVNIEYETGGNWIGNTYYPLINHEQSILNCYPLVTYKKKDENTQWGLVFYHAVNKMITLLDNIEEELLNDDNFNTSDDDW